MDIISLALQEDIGSGDKSTTFLESKIVSADILSREAGIFFGKEIILRCFTNMDIVWHISDGAYMPANTIIATLRGKNIDILTKERTALNFLQILCGTATQTYHYVQKIKHTTTKILDTRKTIPGLRNLQKAAVVAAGGVNHRMGLYDMIMFKENHLHNQSMTGLVTKAKEQYPNTNIIIEVETLTQLKEANTLGVTRILCDNFSIEELKMAVSYANTPLEASGNIDIDSLVLYAETGVDYISIGSLTKHVYALDLSLLIYD